MMAESDTFLNKTPPIQECSPQLNDRQRRKNIFDQAIKRRGSLWLTYQRNYFAAKWVGWMGWGVDLLTALFGGILIFMLQETGFNSLVVYLAVGILVTSLVSSFYGPKLRSRDYYKAGQELQELHDEFDDFIYQRIPNLDVPESELEAELRELNTRRHKKNQATPQLGGIWYYAMKAIGKVKWFYKRVTYWNNAGWKGETFDDVMPPRYVPDVMKSQTGNDEKDSEESEDKDSEMSIIERLKSLRQYVLFVG